MIPRKPEWEVGSSPDMHDRLEFAERELAHSHAVAARAVRALRAVVSDCWQGADPFDKRNGTNSGPDARKALDEITASGWTE